MIIRSLGENTELRLLELRHAHAFQQMVEANADRLYWMPREFTVEDAAGRIRVGLERLASAAGLLTGIFDGGVLVGCVALFHVEPRTHTGELGYWISEGTEGRGLVTKACHAIVDYAFEDLGLRRLEIKCAAGNTRSAAVAVRLGFTLEGRLRRVEPVGEVWDDLLVYGLLADEWGE
jgi:ribosomal-protein-serine acetyltransferase